MQNNVSYLRRATDVPGIEETIGACFDRTAKRYAEREALEVVHQRVCWTYRQLHVRVDSLAIGLLDLGLTPGDRIGIWSPGCAESVLTQFATAKAGLILVNINPAYRRDELEYVLDKFGCRALILAPNSKSVNYIDTLRSIAPELDSCAPGRLQAMRVPELKFVIRLGIGSTSGNAQVRRPGRAANPNGEAGTVCPGREPASDGSHSHSVRCQHDRATEGSNADSPDHSQEWFLCWRGDQAHRIRGEWLDRVIVKAPKPSVVEASGGGVKAATNLSR